MQNENPAVLVTGAAGYIGGHVVRLLAEKGVSVKAVSYYDTPAVVTLESAVNGQTTDVISTTQTSEFEGTKKSEDDSTEQLLGSSNLPQHPRSSNSVNCLKEHLKQLNLTSLVEFVEVPYPPTHNYQLGNMWKQVLVGCSDVIHTSGPFFDEESDDFINQELIDLINILPKSDGTPEKAELNVNGTDDVEKSKEPIIEDVAFKEAKDCNVDMLDGDKKLNDIIIATNEPSTQPANKKTGILTPKLNFVKGACDKTNPTGLLIESARICIQQLLEACRDVGTVKRVILTSSISTIIGNPSQADLSKEYNENDWNQLNANQFASSDLNAGIRSIVERYAWDFAISGTDILGAANSSNLHNGAASDGKDEIKMINGESHGENEDTEFQDALDGGHNSTKNALTKSEPNKNVSFTLVILNPVLVLGPSINDTYSGPGYELIRKLMKKEVPALPKVNILIIDVRDLALAHYNALIAPEASGHRFIVSNRGIWLKEMVNVLNKEFSSTHHVWCSPNNPQNLGEVTLGSNTLPVSSAANTSNTLQPKNGTTPSNMGSPYYTLIPTLQCPSFLAGWLKTFFFDSKTLKNYYMAIVGKELHVSNEKMKNYLRIIPRELHQTIVDTAFDLIENGKLSRPTLGPIINTAVKSTTANGALMNDNQLEVGNTNNNEEEGSTNTASNNNGAASSFGTGYAALFGLLNKKSVTGSSEKKNSLKTSASLQEPRKKVAANMESMGDDNAANDQESTGVTLLNEAALESENHKAKTLDGLSKRGTCSKGGVGSGRPKLHHSLSMNRVKIFGTKGWHNLISFTAAPGNKDGTTAGAFGDDKDNKQDATTNETGDKEKSETLKSGTSASSGVGEEILKDKLTDDSDTAGTSEASPVSGASGTGPAASIRKGIKIAKKKWSLHYHHNNPSSNKKSNVAQTTNLDSLEPATLGSLGLEAKVVGTEDILDVQEPPTDNLNEPITTNGDKEHSQIKNGNREEKSQIGGMGFSSFTGMAKCFPHYFKSLVMMDSSKFKNPANNKDSITNGDQTSNQDHQINGMSDAGNEIKGDHTLTPEQEPTTFTSYVNNNASSNLLAIVSQQNVVDGNTNSSISIARVSVTKNRLGLTPTPSPPPVVLISSRPITPDSERMISPLTKNYSSNEACFMNGDHQSRNINDVNICNKATSPTESAVSPKFCQNFVSSLQGISILSSQQSPIAASGAMNGYHDGEEIHEDESNNRNKAENGSTNESQSCSKSLAVNA